MNKSSSLLGLAFLCLGACSGSPRSILDNVIQSKHFIPYELPMPATKVGTILRGDANEMALVAPPETCFKADDLRWTQATDLPNEFKNVEFDFNASANDLLNTGSATISFNANAKFVKTVQIEFGPASVEMLNEMNFADELPKMSAACQNVISRYQFIGQNLRVDSMKFSFKDQSDGAINLNAKLSEIAIVAGGLNWHIENDYTLVIESPKYIGYRMAKLVTTPAGVDLQYAMTADKKGQWQFKSLGR